MLPKRPWQSRLRRIWGVFTSGPVRLGRLKLPGQLMSCGVDAVKTPERALHRRRSAAELWGEGIA
jgi:hypothetical protein